jgi:hypothetical protein
MTEAEGIALTIEVEHHARKRWREPARGPRLVMFSALDAPSKRPARRLQVSFDRPDEVLTSPSLMKEFMQVVNPPNF